MDSSLEFSNLPPESICDIFEHIHDIKTIVSIFKTYNPDLINLASTCIISINDTNQLPIEILVQLRGIRQVFSSVYIQNPEQLQKLAQLPHLQEGYFDFSDNLSVLEILQYVILFLKTFTLNHRSPANTRFLFGNESLGLEMDHPLLYIHSVELDEDKKVSIDSIIYFLSEYQLYSKLINLDTNFLNLINYSLPSTYNLENYLSTISTISMLNLSTMNPLEIRILNRLREQLHTITGTSLILDDDDFENLLPSLSIKIFTVMVPIYLVDPLLVKYPNLEEIHLMGYQYLIEEVQGVFKISLSDQVPFEQLIPISLKPKLKRIMITTPYLERIPPSPKFIISQFDILSLPEN